MFEHGGETSGTIILKIFPCRYPFIRPTDNKVDSVYQFLRSKRIVCGNA